MRASWVLICVTCLMVAGCNKTETPVEAAPLPSAAASNSAAKSSAKKKTDTRPVIVALGDSIAEGYGVDSGQSFPALLQTRLQSQGLEYRVVNLGVSGDTTTGGLGRIDYAISLKPEVLILELGGNDGLRGINPAHTKANLDQMITKAKAAGVDVLLAGMTLPPNYGAVYVREFEKIYTDLARKHSIPLIPFLMEEIRLRFFTTPGLMQRDGIHPTAKGHELIADTVMEYLKPMLPKT